MPTTTKAYYPVRACNPRWWQRSRLRPGLTDHRGFRLASPGGISILTAHLRPSPVTSWLFSAWGLARCQFSEGRETQLLLASNNTTSALPGWPLDLTGHQCDPEPHCCGPICRGELSQTLWGTTLGSQSPPWYDPTPLARALGTGLSQTPWGAVPLGGIPPGNRLS